GAFWGTGYAAYAFTSTPGYFIHTWNLYNKDLVRPLYLILVYGCCYSVVLPLLKTAILLDWCRLFVPASPTRSGFWWTCMVLIVIQCIWGFVCVLLLNLQCVPHRAIWEFYLPSKCFELSKIMLTSATIQLLIDLSMVLLPQKTIWGLHINWQKKLGVSVIFGVGLLASVAACFRLAYTVNYSQNPDKMYFISTLMFWTFAEMTCGFFILSVPCIPRVIAESGLPRRVKMALGISLQSSGPSNCESNIRPRSKSHKMSKSTTASNMFYKMKEVGIPMSDLNRPESQEQLRDGNNVVMVTRTTHVAITPSSQSDDETRGKVTSWTA
ncbi:unnamed protein product, partial [Clonostachys solani]